MESEEYMNRKSRKQRREAEVSILINIILILITIVIIRRTRQQLRDYNLPSIVWDPSACLLSRRKGRIGKRNTGNYWKTPTTRTATQGCTHGWRSRRERETEREGGRERERERERLASSNIIHLIWGFSTRNHSREERREKEREGNGMD
jgi:hypothetical protein